MAPEGYNLADLMTAAVRAGFEKNGSFASQQFSRTHPSVKRGLAEGSLRSALLLEPFTGMAESQPKAVVLGKLLRADYTAAGVVEDFSYDEAKKSAKLIATLELCDVKAAKMMGSVVLTVTSEGETEAVAAKAAAAKFADSAVPQAIAMLTAPPKKDGRLGAF
jgi:hypothetical protein